MIFRFRARASLIKSAERGAGVKDAGATGASTAWPAGAQGQGSRPQAVIRARRGEVSGHKTLLSLVHRAAEGPTVLRPRQEALR